MPNRVDNASYNGDSALSGSCGTRHKWPKEAVSKHASIIFYIRGMKQVHCLIHEQLL